MSTDLAKLYADRKDTFEKQAETLLEKEKLTSWLRVVLMIIVIVLIYFSFKTFWLGWLVALLLVLYIYLVKYHENLKHQVKLKETLATINAWELRSLDGDHTSYANGNEFVDSHHPFSYDLDFFGEGSFFQRINRTSTEPGKEELAKLLTRPLASIPEIKKRQEAIQELATKLDFRQHFQAVGLSSQEKKEDQEKILDWLKLPAFVYGNKSYHLLLIGLPILSLAGIVVWILTGLYTPTIGVALIQWAIIGSHAKRVTLFQDYIGNKKHLLEKFAGHFELLNGEKFQTELTIHLSVEGHEAREQLLSLASRSRALDLRLNLITTLLLNSTVLYDLQCIYRLEHWREKNRGHLEKWLAAIAETDALNSLGAFAFNHPRYVTPEISNENELIMEELGHPLIPESNCVNNDVKMTSDSKVWIVTGANMAGKSTFLRSVGINTVLALAGSVVCARKMKCPLIDVYSGMRNTDSIYENQSYFFAELLRLQTIIKKLQEGRKVLILLDEILRGTNSEDKLSGSKELVKQLVAHSCLALIATHDVALGEMEKVLPQVRNFHFETITTSNDELAFDYKLKPGISTGKNATFLMRKMGIIPS